MSYTLLHHNRSISFAAGQSLCLWGANTSCLDQFYTDLSLMDLGIISSQILQTIYEEEMQKDDSDFMDRIDIGTTVREFLPENALSHPLLAQFSMTELLDRGFRQLSSGQGKKLLILREIFTGKKGLVFYNPYDGLDVASCKELNGLMQEISASTAVLILVQNREDIPSWVDNLGIFIGDELVHYGSLDKTLPHLPQHAESFQDIEIAKAQESREKLVQLVDGFAAYGDNVLFSKLQLSIYTGQHTLITGHNGCGKSTLLHILTGDNSKCYANNLEVFGKKRGSGESIWEIKKDMGIVSPELHRNHRCAGSALEILLGGLYDSIGLYKRPSLSEKKEGQRWMKWLDMEVLANTPFRKLSFAQQRMVLIGRGLIKMPKLLILDEPTQGLDEKNRYQVLFLMEKIARERLSTIVFVSHRQDEHRDFFTQTIPLDQYK